MISDVPTSIWLIGCGNMAGAMLSQWVKSGVVDPATVTVVDPGQPRLPGGVRHVASLPDEAAPEAVMIGVKPQMLDDIAGALAPRIKGVKLLLSILAGVEVASLARRFEATRLTYTMGIAANATATSVAPAQEWLSVLTRAKPRSPASTLARRTTPGVTGSAAGRGVRVVGRGDTLVVGGAATRTILGTALRGPTGGGNGGNEADGGSEREGSDLHG